MTRVPRNTLFALLVAAAPGLVACGDTRPVDHGHADATAVEGHDSHAAHGSRDTPMPARRWIPDAPLSRGMQRVRTATAMLEHGAHGHLDDAQVRGIAAELKSAVDTMFAECKLEPEPDAALHSLLARVLMARNRLAESGYDAAALAELKAVLDRYPLLFEDADWSVSHKD